MPPGEVLIVDIPRCAWQVERDAARMIRCGVLSELAGKHWQLLAENIGKGDTDIFHEPVFPKGEQQGFGFHEAPRDGEGQPVPYEASLVGNPVADPEQPLEVLRTIHSFDPCIACAIHTLDVDGNEIARVKAL